MTWKPLALILAAPCLGAPPSEVLRAESVEDLDFGALVTRAEPGGTTLSPLGGVHAWGGLSRGPGLPRPGRLILKGPAGATYTVRFSPAAVRGGAAPSGISALHAPGGVFDGAGNAVIPVGATLVKPAGAPAGAEPLVWVTVESPAANPVTVALPVRVRFMAALQATVERALDFGAILAPEADAAVWLEPGGRRVSEGKLSLGARSGHAARFRIHGEPGAPFSVLLPPRLRLEGPGAPLHGMAFVADPVRGLLVGGRACVGVGATLKVPAGQKPGAYRGTFVVSFAYE